MEIEEKNTYHDTILPIRINYSIYGSQPNTILKVLKDTFLWDYTNEDAELIRTIFFLFRDAELGVTKELLNDVYKLCKVQIFEYLETKTQLSGIVPPTYYT